MEDFLKAIDDSIKRLITPVTVLIAASFLLEGLNSPKSSPATIYTLFAILCVWAFVYTLVSAGYAVKQINESLQNRSIAIIACLSFMPVYFVLIISAIVLGFKKVV